MPKTRELQTRTAQLLASVRAIEAAWVFGSQATGKTHSNSDLDIGYLSRRPLSLEELLHLQATLSELWKLERVDLVDLRRADPVLAFEAIRGELTINRCATTTAGLVSRICREYEESVERMQRDTAWLRQRLLDRDGGQAGEVGAGL